MKTTTIGVFVDNPTEKRTYQQVLQRFEHKVEGYVFSSPEEGLEVTQTVKFDVVFIEIHYWGENFGGISILDQINKVTGRKILAIALTSFLQDGDLEKIIEAGFSMCIEKPISMEALQLFCSHGFQHAD